MADYDIGKAFAKVEHELMASMIRNMKRHRLEEIDEKKQWSMWQAEQMIALEKFKRENRKKYGEKFKDINSSIDSLIREAKAQGGMEQEIRILEAMKKGFSPRGLKKSVQTNGEFFKLNERKLEALIKATTDDMKKAETAVLRMAEDQYRQVIFDAQVYANTGAGTYEKAVDMATKDFLSRGINCIEYANGARHTIAAYADMAIRTAAKRAYLQGEGEMRQEWGVSTVIMKKRGNACPLCLPFVGKVMIDDVWSGGTARDGPYPLMSSAIAKGLYHPNCRDVHTTYFEGISTPPDSTFTREEIEQLKEDYRKEQKQQYAKRQADKFGRLEEFSLDEENKKKYGQKRKVLEKEVERHGNSGIIKPEELFRKTQEARSGFKFISDDTFNNLTIAAKKKGAVIMRGTNEVEEHLDKMDAAASSLGEILMFRKDVCISEVLEETYHFEQNLQKMNDDKDGTLRTILNEIDAKNYILENEKKYKIPRNEIELTQKQLESYKEQLKLYEEGRHE